MSVEKRKLLWRRLMAFVADFFLIATLQFTLGFFTILLYRALCKRYGLSADVEVEAFISEFCGAFFFIGYFTLSIGIFGNTLGKSLCKIHVRKEDGHRPLTLVEAYWRSMGYLMSSWTYMIGFILPYFRKDMKALHDLLCGTLVELQAPSAESNERQLELPFLSFPRQKRIPTKPEDHEWGRTGTDR